MNEKKKQEVKSPRNAKPAAPIINVPKTSVSPVLREVGKLAAGVAQVSAGTGSATGNPRNKCALQPGHSLMDWIRLGSSGKDLTGVGSNAGHLTITLSQLAEHDKQSDAWLALRGRVYNVTYYLPFHPGGQEELMKGVGKDATTLFDQVHPWVNYDSILQKCYLGRLVAVNPILNTEAIFFGTEKPQNKVINALKTGSPKYKPATIKVKSASSDEQPPKNPTDEPEAQVALPRFDWIQKIDFINLFFYTCAFANVHIEISPPNHAGSVNIILIYHGQLFMNELAFFKNVKWPCRLKYVAETGKVELQVSKSESGIWNNYGVLKQKYRPLAQIDVRFEYRLVDKVRVTHDTFLMLWERTDGTKLVVPVGNHVRVFGRVNDEEIVRSYTPVPRSLFTKYGCQQFATDDICLTVKRYSDGNISRYLCDKVMGDTVVMSNPLGTFELNEVENRETFLVLAAGTGITPMLGLILFLLERRIRKCQCIRLLFFNKTEEDILFRDQLENLRNDNNRFKVQHVLSQPPPTWPGLKGHINREILDNTIQKHIADTGYVKADIYVTVCGPAVFSEKTDNLLAQLGIERAQVHVFLG